ncbi:threonine aldolase family protein [Providencia rettgeri]|uniref:threonine aldolase family protein n=1 Tax=Providencia rettgeri TaxID=587 RepID=UPI0023AA3914|nr:GntG family PLP-dependent aldolase [Providencia rettgeri]
MDYIDLRSDTLTKISPNDLTNIDFSKIGDDCYNEDEYVKGLERFSATLFGKESALFMPSGTMSNQIGLRVLANPGDEVITETGYHVCYFESSPTSALSGLVINNIKTSLGILTVKDIIEAINNKSRWSNLYAVPKVISIESSIGTYGGRIFPIEEIKALRRLCDDRGISLYLDGARVLNSCVALSISPECYVKDTDLLNVCLSKGIGAPFGSVLIGKERDIQIARKLRKWYGGALHQSGLMAFIALKKLKDYKVNIKKDHENAQYLSKILEPFFEIRHPVETNIIMVNKKNAHEFSLRLKEFGILATAWTNEIIRFVTSSNINKGKLDELNRVFKLIGGFKK